MIPPYAISLWTEGDKLVVAFSGESHHISIPIERAEVCRNDFGTPLPNQRGWDLILKILLERYRADKSERNQIARQSAPIQYMAEAILKAKVTYIGKRKAKPELSLEDLDII